MWKTVFRDRNISELKETEKWKKEDYHLQAEVLKQTIRIYSGPSLYLWALHLGIQPTIGQNWSTVGWICECGTAGTEGQLYYAILYKGLGHLQILVSAGVLEPIPADRQDDCISLKND